MPRVNFHMKVWPHQLDAREGQPPACTLSGVGEVYGALEEPPGNIALVVFCEIANTWRIVPLSYCRPEPPK